ncbi:hypothetical protein KAR91_73895, partial [Candidatus Pacearchaeota archaeon]|nr:hypothetical protein [Candidatus Pacearchaeota archaeon]
ISRVVLPMGRRYQATYFGQADERGSLGKVRSTIHPITSPGWVSSATGVNLVAELCINDKIGNS